MTFFVLVALVLSFSGCHRTDGTVQGSITLHPSVTYQTINGWEATAWAAEIVESNTLGVRKENLAFSIYRDALFDQAINDLGINRVRLEVKPGLENTVDYFPQYLAGQITFRQLNKYRETPVNDDADPLTINADGFKFAELDHKIETVVKPLRDRLKVRGELLHINLKYVSDPLPNTFQHTNAAEYAEFMLAVFQHMQAKYGFVPNTVEPVLEPDRSSADWTPTKIGQVVAAAGARLEASGFTPKFGVPSTTDANLAASWFDGAAAVPGAHRYFGEVVYHRYDAPSSATLQAIAQRGAQVGGAAQLELIGATYVDLHQDLKFGNNTAWSQYVLAGPVGGDNGAKYYVVDESNPKAPVVRLGSRTKFLRQYFRYIRRGAVRIEATTSNNSFDPVAFRNADDRYVVVVKAARGGSFQIVGLPAGSYGLSYTLSARSEVIEQDVKVGSGQVLTARIPAAGVITVYEKSGSPTH